MDKLDSIFQKQIELDDIITKAKNIDLSQYSKEEWLQKKALALIEEVTEVVQETNYKWWKTKNQVDYNKVKEEVVDILHFLVSMCLTLDMTSDELFAIYKNKHNENIDRQNGKSKKQGYV